LVRVYEIDTPIRNVFDCPEFLTTLFEQLNAKEVIAVKVPGQARYSVASHEYYSIDLLSTTDFADKPEEFEPLGI
jgi:hypothetical protein